MTERSALNNPNFRIYLTGAAVSLHGVWIFRVALAWFAWQLTGSEAWVGAIAFTQFAPAVLFGPVFGVIADRFERRKLSMLVNTGSAINMVALTLLVSNDVLGIAGLAAASFVQGMLDGAHTPVRMSLVPDLVEREELSSAIASNSVAFNASRVIGPAVAGFIIARFGVATAFAINAVTYLAIVISVGIVDIRRRPNRGEASTNALAQLMEGVRYVQGHALIRLVLVVILINTVFGRGVLEMMPAVADGILERGSAGLAAMTSAVGAGAVIVGIFLARGTRWLDFGALRITLFVSAVLSVLYGISSNFTLTLFAVGVLGGVLSLCGIGSQILIQSSVDDDIRGRVSSLWSMIAFGGTAFGGLLIGAIADVVGLRETLIAAGVLSGLVSLALPSKPSE